MHGHGQHGADIRGAGGRGAAQHGQRPVRVLYTDGPGHRAGHRTEHIVQRRGVRAAAAQHADVRAQRVLLRRLFPGDQHVRVQQELEIDADHHHLRARPQSGHTDDGEYTLRLYTAVVSTPCCLPQ